MNSIDSCKKFKGKQINQSYTIEIYGHQTPCKVVNSINRLDFCASLYKLIGEDANDRRPTNKYSKIG